MSQEKDDQKANVAADKKPKQRSPAYPFIDIEKALGYVKTMWQKENRHDVKASVLATHFDIEPKSSALSLTLSAMAKYGLVDEVGVFPNRTFKLSALALKTLREDLTEQEKLAVHKDIALKPEIFRYLWSKYGASLPSDVALKTHLVMDKHFTEPASAVVIRNYKSTISFAKLTDSDTLVDSTSEEPEIEEDSPQAEKMMETPTEKPLKQASGVVYREFAVPLPSGAVGTFKVPYPMGENDFKVYSTLLAAFEPGLVKKE